MYRPRVRDASAVQGVYLTVVYMAGCIVSGLTFLLWGSVSDPTVLSMLAVFEGIGFSLLFTTAVVIVGRLLPRSLCSTGNAVGQMVSSGSGRSSARRSSRGSRRPRPPSASLTRHTDVAPTCRFAEDPRPLPRWAAHLGKRGTDG